VLVERREVVVAVAAREDRGVDARMERLHAAAEQLRDLGQVLDQQRVDAVLGEVRGGAAARDELDAEVGEPARELGEAGLVVDGEERPHRISSRTTSGRRRCSTRWMRARSVSTVSSGSTGTVSCRITGPVSTPASM
jgi:hypothetical protein